MKEIKLIERVPFMNNGQFTFPEIGTIFEVLEEKNLKCVGLMYRIRYKKYPSLKVEGFHNPNSFKEVKE